jgi:pseudomonalisin
VSLSLRLLLLSATCLASVTFAQAPPPRRNLVSDAPSASDRVRLEGHVLAGQDQLTPSSAVIPTSTLRLTFILSRPPESQAAFQHLLTDQQNPTSPRYHHWLTPNQIGEQYGPAGHDLSALTDWLVSQGLSVREVAPSGIFIQVEGSAASISTALDTDLRYIERSATPGIAPRIAATRNPAIPSAFGALVESIAGLSGEEANPLQRVTGIPITDLSGRFAPRANAAPASHYISPNDFAQIYGVNPVYNSGVDGTGQAVAIIGRSGVLAADITNFAAFASRPARLPNVIVPSSGADPGLTGDGDQAEATLDVDRVLGTAPGVHVDLIISSSLSGGIETAAQYEVQTLLDPIMSVSFGACEAAVGLPYVRFWDALFTQAAAEGISPSWPPGTQARLVAATQTPHQSQTRAPESTHFAPAQTSPAWGEPSSPTSPILQSIGAPPRAQAASLRLATFRREHGTSPLRQALQALQPTLPLPLAEVPATYIGKPSWQTGPGVPSDGFRDVPDVSFSRSLHDGYLICLAYAGLTVPVRSRSPVALPPLRLRWPESLRYLTRSLEPRKETSILSSTRSLQALCRRTLTPFSMPRPRQAASLSVTSEPQVCATTAHPLPAD